MKCVFWDMDGTVVDTQAGVLEAFDYAADTLGVPRTPHAQSIRAIGPATEYGMEHILGVPKELVMQGVRIFDEYYLAEGVKNSVIYAGIEELLLALREMGIKNCIASMKDDAQVKRCMELRGLNAYFDGDFGVRWDDPARTKQCQIEKGLALFGADAAGCIMVGDSFSDIDAGKALGMRTVAVTYGYGDPQQLRESGADAYVDTVEELGRVLKDMLQ